VARTSLATCQLKIALVSFHLTAKHAQPAFLFLGEEFKTSDTHKQLKSLLVDLFQGTPAVEVNVMGVQRAFVCTALPQGKVALRHYAIELKATGTKVRMWPSA
jgi:hypothetical protein